MTNNQEKVIVSSNLINMDYILPVLVTEEEVRLLSKDIRIERDYSNNIIAFKDDSILEYSDLQGVETKELVKVAMDNVNGIYHEEAFTFYEIEPGCGVFKFESELYSGDDVDTVVLSRSVQKSINELVGKEGYVIITPSCDIYLITKKSVISTFADDVKGIIYHPEPVLEMVKIIDGRIYRKNTIPLVG